MTGFLLVLNFYWSKTGISKLLTKNKK